jgi:DNA-binding response OmpR family regulator
VLVLLDWHLPFMDGALFLQALRAWAPVLPSVVVLTAPEDDANTVRQRGAAAVLTVAAATDLTPVVHVVTDLMPLDRSDGAVT